NGFIIHTNQNRESIFHMTSTLHYIKRYIAGNVDPICFKSTSDIFEVMDIVVNKYSNLDFSDDEFNLFLNKTVQLKNKEIYLKDVFENDTDIVANYFLINSGIVTYSYNEDKEKEGFKYPNLEMKGFLVKL